MHKQMVALIPDNNLNLTFNEIFGYTSRGIPGLEIVGVGAKGREIKEKLIYLNKKYNVKIPPWRFVICINDESIIAKGSELYRWLELPFLLMYWSMAEVIPLKHLDNCMCGGKISARGKIETISINLDRNDKMINYINEGYKLITASGNSHHEAVIPVDEIITFAQI